jgi:hypothetical protein
MFTGIHADELPETLELVLGDRLAVKLVKRVKPFSDHR